MKLVILLPSLSAVHEPMKLKSTFPMNTLEIGVPNTTEIYFFIAVTEGNSIK